MPQSMECKSGFDIALVGQFSVQFKEYRPEAILSVGLSRLPVTMMGELTLASSRIFLRRE
jgi:hypothetical protein